MTKISTDIYPDSLKSSGEKGIPFDSEMRNSALNMDQQEPSLKFLENTPESVNAASDHIQQDFDEKPHAPGISYPSRFVEIIPVIAQITEKGFVCFLNPENLEIEPVPAKMLENPEAFYNSYGSSARGKPFQHLLWNDCLMFEPIPEELLQKLVDGFLQQLEGQPVYDKLLRMIKKNKPFSKVNALIERSVDADHWNSFKMHFLGKIISDKLIFYLTDNEGNTKNESPGM